MVYTLIPTPRYRPGIPGTVGPRNFQARSFPRSCVECGSRYSLLTDDGRGRVSRCAQCGHVRHAFTT